MKKFLALALVIVLVLSIGAGCGNKGGDDEAFDALGEIKANSDIIANDSEPSGGDTSGGGDAGPSSGGVSGWPASDLPPGLPVYPDGEVSKVDIDAIGVFVVIDGTSPQSFSMYKMSMENEGWNFLVENSAKKDRYIVALSIISNTSVGILAKESDTEAYESPLVPVDWPADIPAYPDGNAPDIKQMDGTGSIFIKIANTSAASLGKYADTLTADGWKTSLRTDDDKKMIFDKIDERKSLSIDLDDKGTTVSMTFIKLK